jgi:hypothetical protein
MPVVSPSLAQAELNLRCVYGREEVLNYSLCRHAGVAHLVERRPSKSEVAGSSPVSRSAPKNKCRMIHQ